MIVTTFILLSALSAPAQIQELPVIKSTSASASASTSDAQLIKKKRKSKKGAGDFIEKYYPFTYDENLASEVEDNKIVAHLLMTILPFGAIWVPMVMFGDETPDGYLSDVIISLLIHGASILPFCLFIPAIPLAIIVVQVWLMPVASINIWNRNLKGRRRKKRAINAIPQPHRQATLHEAAPAMAF